LGLQQTAPSHTESPRLKNYRPMPENPKKHLSGIPDFHWWKKNAYFHGLDSHYIRRMLPIDGSVLAFGFGQDRLISSLNFSNFVYVDAESKFVDYYKIHLPKLNALYADIETEPFFSSLSDRGPFDLILLPDTLSYILDIQTFLIRMAPLCSPNTRILFSNHSRTWEPILRIAEFFAWKRPSPPINLLRPLDVRDFWI
jgi:2-polyprenyl-3-methyl-5-hydroxy-6-metoxy-1,4-benzoquinol methylase